MINRNINKPEKITAKSLPSFVQAHRHNLTAAPENMVVSGNIKGKKIEHKQLNAEMTELVDLSGISFKNTDFSQCQNISGADFSYADLRGCNFNSVQNLDSCVFAEARIAGTDFSNTGIKAHTLAESRGLEKNIAIIDKKLKRMRVSLYQKIYKLTHSLASKFIKSFTNILHRLDDLERSFLLLIVNTKRHLINKSQKAIPKLVQIMQYYQNVVQMNMQALFQKRLADNFKAKEGPKPNSFRSYADIADKDLYEMNRQFSLGRSGAKKELESQNSSKA